MELVKNVFGFLLVVLILVEASVVTKESSIRNDVLLRMVLRPVTNWLVAAGDDGGLDEVDIFVSTLFGSCCCPVIM